MEEEKVITSGEAYIIFHVIDNLTKDISNKLIQSEVK